MKCYINPESRQKAFHPAATPSTPTAPHPQTHTATTIFATVSSDKITTLHRKKKESGKAGKKMFSRDVRTETDRSNFLVEILPVDLS